MTGRREATPPPADPPRRAAAAAAPADRPRRSGPGAAPLVAGLIALAAVVVVFLLLSGGDDDNGKQTAKETATPAAKKTATPTPAAEKTQTPAPTATEEPAQPAAGEPAGSDPRALQLKAFNLNNEGKPEEALPYAQKAVKLGCKGSAPVNPCGYALFELAKAQRATGDPKAAVKTLEERLKRYPDDQRPAVEAELEKAKADAGE